MEIIINLDWTHKCRCPSISIQIIHHLSAYLATPTLIPPISSFSTFRPDSPSPKCIDSFDGFLACVNVMGCTISKRVTSPFYHSSVIILDSQASSLNIKEEVQDDEISEDKKKNHVVIHNPDAQPSYCDCNYLNFGRLTEAEYVAAGWPSWLSAVAGEAIHGWLPLKSDSFQRLEKIGQGTYSSVYRARNTESGRMVALKKVRFDTFQPESVKFMAREITILRRLHHPNIMKLEGIITSRLSCNVYFVFEYMEHDLSGLVSCPDIKFSDSQIKCYMRQLLNGIGHCHSLGILHRDIKTANILVNNEGVVKIADFGLANFDHKQSLTSRVVTLWYRPPELLLGCTKYGTYVDLWSVGCVFAELFFGRPILKGGTEVEQLHKIFKLCGSPPDGYWNKSKLPLATMFKPHHAYESSLGERCKDLPETAVNLIETLLSVEACKRGTATSALQSQYFNTKPYACDPASLPKYPPNKEIHAKVREEARRKKGGGMVEASRNPTRVRCTEVKADRIRNKGGGAYSRGSVDCHASSKASVSDSICALPIQTTASNGGFVWAKRRQKHPTPNGTGMPENGESARSRDEIVRRAKASFDSSKVHNFQDLSFQIQKPNELTSEVK